MFGQNCLQVPNREKKKNFDKHQHQILKDFFKVVYKTGPLKKDLLYF